MSFIAPKGARSATAADGWDDAVDDNLYASGLLGNLAAAAIPAPPAANTATEAQGKLVLFTQPQGSNTPALPSSLVTGVPLHNPLSKATTSQEKAGELGKGFGDAAVRAITIGFEQAEIHVDGYIPDNGMTVWEMAQAAKNLAVRFEVGKKEYIGGALRQFPSIGGVEGVTNLIGRTDAAATTVFRGLGTNGNPGRIRRLVKHIQIERQDTIKVELEFANSASLRWRTTTAGPTAPATGFGGLVFIDCPAFVRRDVR